MDESELERALADVWNRHLPDTNRRLDRVAAALLALAAGSGDETSRAAAREDVHQLLGLAATFHRTALSELARAAQPLLDGSRHLDAEAHVEARQIAEQLRAMIGSGPER